jgi:hypothetical protein
MELNNKRQQSEFNMAVSYLNRLNSIFYACDIASMELDAHSWFMALCALKRELSTEMKPGELDWFNNMTRQINPMVQQNYKQIRQNGYNQIDSALYDLLDAYESKLRMILEESGLQKKKADDFLEPEES